MSSLLDRLRKTTFWSARTHVPVMSPSKTGLFLSTKDQGSFSARLLDTYGIEEIFTRVISITCARTGQDTECCLLAGGSHDAYVSIPHRRTSVYFSMTRLSTGPKKKKKKKKKKTVHFLALSQGQISTAAKLTSSTRFLINLPTKLENRNLLFYT
jgi:hypothetical protein